MTRKIEKQAKKHYVKPIVKSEVLNNKFGSDRVVYTAGSPDYRCGACAGGSGRGPC